MGYLHSRREQIIHRDLKSLNVLITEGMDCKVADFGLTVMREATTGAANNTQVKNQRSDTNHSLFSNSGADFFGIEGTAQYMAPEVMEGGRYNHKVDVYSFGILLTELLTRKMPFKDLYSGFDFVDAVIDRAERPTIPFWASTTASVTNVIVSGGEVDDDGISSATASAHASPSELGDLVMKCTNRDPSSRPDFKQIIIKLEQLKSLPEEELFLKFDLPRIRELMDLGDVDDLINVAEELCELSNLLLYKDEDISSQHHNGANSSTSTTTTKMLNSKKSYFVKFLQNSNLLQCILNRIAYGRASKLLEKGKFVLALCLTFLFVGEEVVRNLRSSSCLATLLRTEV
jgi:serine/threonine protein kinase